MYFVLNNQRYIVVITPPRRPPMLDGKPREALIEPLTSRILIAYEVPRAERRLRLFHELGHFYENAFGVPDLDTESRTQRQAEFADWLDEEFQKQGGAAALEAMEPPPETIAATRAGPADLGAWQFECPYCKTPIMAGSTIDDPPEKVGDSGSWRRCRALDCDSCNRVAVFYEACTQDGIGLGCVLPHPKARVLTGSEARAWRIEKQQEICR